MKIISHRANINGPSTAYFGENHPSSIQNALCLGYDVEIDVWLINNSFILGHDGPQFEVKSDFFFNNKLWIHCKNIQALYKLYDNSLANCFFHNEDDCVLTSHGYIWTYPRNLFITNKSIAVMPERVENWNINNAFGVCTDFPKNYI